MAHHVKKLTVRHWHLAESKAKMFEIRLDDCNYRVGDTLTLVQWSDAHGDLGGRLERLIICRSLYMQRSGYVVLGLAEV